MNPFEIDVLGRVADDVEAVHTIRDDLERDLDRPVSDQEVGAALVRLAAAGFLATLAYDETQQHLRPVDPGHFASEDLWFEITREGRIAYARCVP
jgi:hypothetical protein